MSSTQKEVFISIYPFGKADTTPIKMLEKAGFSLRFNPYKRKITPTELETEIKLANAIIAGTEKLSKVALNNASNLSIISRVGVGTDSVDKDYCEQNNIKIAITPDAPIQAVAELSLGMILEALRGINIADRSIRDNQWVRPMGGLLQNKTIGLVGFGRIARRLASLLKPFHVKIVAYDPFLSEGKIGDISVQLTSFKKLLAKSDVISLHCALTSETKHIFNKQSFDTMLKKPILINCSRGALIDETALIDALNNGKLRHASLDVFEQEPYNGPLAMIRNCTLTSHIGSSTVQTRVQMETEAAQAIINHFG